MCSSDLGVLNIANGHRKAALNYFQDGSIEDAIPPIRALLHIMAYGEYEGHTVDSPVIRDLFKKETILSSDWYLKRLKHKQKIDIELMERKIANLEEFIANPINESVIGEFQYETRLQTAKDTLEYYRSDSYLDDLKGTIGASIL